MNLEYVVLYQSNGSPSTHPLRSWESVRAFFADKTPGRMLAIPSSFGGESCIFREDITSIHLVTEAEIENNAQRRAAILKAEATAEEEWK
jgi:hypothetical protein